MVTVIVVAVIVYGAFHLGAGHTHHRYGKAHGLQPRVYWSLGRGPTAASGCPADSESATNSDSKFCGPANPDAWRGRTMSVSGSTPRLPRAPPLT